MALTHPPPSMPSAHWVWTRPVSPKWIDAWLERLAFVGADRLTVVEKPGGRLARLEAWPKTEAEGKKLVRHFGGRLRKLPVAAWFGKATSTAPMKFGKNLVIIPEEGETKAASKKAAKPSEKTKEGPALLRIPAGLAFGTGQHATTGMILRELSALPRESWDGLRLLDAGTGSGILALAMRALSGDRAERIDAFDYDPQSIKTAKANERRNYTKALVTWSEADVQRWKPPVRYHVVSANLFSDLLVKQGPVFARAVVPGGLLLLSGILKSQAPEVVGAFSKVGFRLDLQKNRGKWTMMRWTKAKANAKGK